MQQISSAFFLVRVTALSLLSFDEDEVGACARGGEDGVGRGGVGEVVEFGRGVFAAEAGEVGIFADADGGGLVEVG